MGMKLPTLSVETKARIKLFLLSLTATTQRKIIASGVVGALGAIGFTAVAPETVESILLFIGSVAATFYAG